MFKVHRDLYIDIDNVGLVEIRNPHKVDKEFYCQVNFFDKRGELIRDVDLPYGDDGDYIIEFAKRLEAA